MQCAGFNAKVVDESASSGQKRRVFHALDRLAAPARCHY
jgi:hypothetical protein